jgi:hypothetical protein
LAFAGFAAIPAFTSYYESVAARDVPKLVLDDSAEDSLKALCALTAASLLTEGQRRNLGLAEPPPGACATQPGNQASSGNR